MYTVLNMDYSTFIYYLSKFTSSVMLNMHRVLHLISHLPTAWLSLWKHGHACVSLCVGVGVGVCVCVCGCVYDLLGTHPLLLPSLSPSGNLRGEGP